MAITLVGSSGNTASAIDGADITITISTDAVQAGDIALVTYSVPRAAAMSVLSSNGTAYTQIGATINSGTTFTGCWYRVMTSSERTATCIGTGNLSDPTVGCSLVLRGFSPYLTLASNSTTGSGSNKPDSPAVSVLQIGDAVISAVGINKDDVLTAPTSYVNAVSTSRTDASGLSAGMAWVTSTAAGSENPTSWTAGTAGSWTAFTITLKSTDVYVPFRMTAGQTDLPRRMQEPKPFLHSGRYGISVLPYYSGNPDPHFIGWYCAFTDPNRVLEPKPFLQPGRYGFARLGFILPPPDLDPHIVPWYQPLTEPRRFKQPLSAPWIEVSPFVPRPYVSFSFALTESHDFSNINVNVYWPKQDAKVTITEIETYPTRVTIKEIKYTRGYS